MTITTPDLQSRVPAPAGAVWIDEWTGDGDDRGRDFNHHVIDVDDVSLMICGVQYLRGGTGRSIVLRLAPEVVAHGADFTPKRARRLAAMLQNLADTCEILDEVAR